MWRNRWPTDRERGQVERALGMRDVTKVTIVCEDNSPWLIVDVWVHMEGEVKLALWRATGAVFRVGPDGAVEDDPIEWPAWEPGHPGEVEPGGLHGER